MKTLELIGPKLFLRAGLKTSLVLCASLLLSPVVTLAESEEDRTPEFVDAPEPPELPNPVESGETLEPEVTIIRKDDATITEYRVNGNLYKVKIVPAVGKPYYLIDKDGDGELESRVNNIYQDVNVPQWVLFEW